MTVIFDTIVFQQQQQQKRRRRQLETKWKKCTTFATCLKIILKWKWRTETLKWKTAANVSMFWILFTQCFWYLCVCFIFTHYTHLITYINRAFVIVVIAATAWLKLLKLFHIRKFCRILPSDAWHSLLLLQQTHTRTRIHITFIYFMLLLFENYIAHDNGSFLTCTTYPRNVCWASTRTARSHLHTSIDTNTCMHNFTIL